jgi:transcriptional regulator with XRE-family HTH domain
MSTIRRVRLNNPALLTWARETAGLSMPRLARKLGVSSAAILRWERGEFAPTYKQLERLAHITQRSVVVLFLAAVPVAPETPTLCCPHCGAKLAVAWCGPEGEPE